MRILIADDEALIRLGLKTMLAEMGHEALLAANGREALDIARTARPDLAILDIRMPLTDGLQAARTIAKSYPMPVLLLTAYSDQAMMDQAAELPIQSYLIKPVDERDLRAAITLAVARFNDARDAAHKVAELQEAVETRKLLDRAKGVLMSRGMTEDEAYHTLQNQARDRRISIRQTAEAVLAES